MQVLNMLIRIDINMMNIDYHFIFTVSHDVKFHAHEYKHDRDRDDGDHAHHSIAYNSCTISKTGQHRLQN